MLMSGSTGCMTQAVPVLYGDLEGSIGGWLAVCEPGPAESCRCREGCGRPSPAHQASLGLSTPASRSGLICLGQVSFSLLCCHLTAHWSIYCLLFRTLKKNETIKVMCTHLYKIQIMQKEEKEEKTFFFLFS